MGNVMGFKIVPSRPKSKLEEFAFSFHQDWALVFPDFWSRAELYLQDLWPQRRRILKRELLAFVAEHGKSRRRSALKAWYKLGAQGWDAKLPLCKTLAAFPRS